MVEVIGVIDKSLIANHFAVVVDKNIAHNGVHPSSKIRIRYILVFIVQCF